MTTHQPTQYSTTSGIWLWGLVGALGVIALLAAMAWVVQGQVEQGHILRAQWQTPARMAKVERYEVERYDVSGRTAQSSNSNNSNKATLSAGIVATSFERP